MGFDDFFGVLLAFKGGTKPNVDHYKRTWRQRKRSHGCGAWVGLSVGAALSSVGAGVGGLVRGGSRSHSERFPSGISGWPPGTNGKQKKTYIRSEPNPIRVYQWTTKSTEHLEVLRYAHENGCQWDKQTCARAAHNGNLEILKYAHKKGCPGDWLACANAAKSGHLETLKYAHGIDGHVVKLLKMVIWKYAHEKGCHWSSSTCAKTAGNGHLEVLKYAHDHDYPRDDNICTLAAEVLRYAHENGCHWDTYTCADAAAGGHLECLKYAHDHGCPWDYRTCRWAVVQGHNEIADWAREHGCPWELIVLLDLTVLQSSRGWGILAFFDTKCLVCAGI